MSSAREFTFDQLSSLSHYPDFLYENPYSQDRLRVFRDNSFIYVVSGNCSEELSLPVKMHINFGSKENIEKGWNTVIPILLKYSKLTKVVKVVDPVVSENLESAGQKFLNDQLTTRLSSIENPAERNFIETEYKRAIAFLAEEAKRVRDTVPVTYYLYRDSTTKLLDVEGIKAMTSEIDQALRKKEFKSTQKASSDFFVSPYVSIRRDYDAYNKYINWFRMKMPENWQFVKSDPVIKSLADEKSLSEVCPPYHSEPFPLRALERTEWWPASILGKIENIANLFAELKHQAPDEIKEPFNMLKEILKFRSLTTIERLFAVIGRGEEAAAILFGTNPKGREFELETTRCCGLFQSSFKKVSLESLFKNFFDVLASYESIGGKQTMAGLSKIYQDLKKINEQLKNSKNKVFPSVGEKRGDNSVERYEDNRKSNVSA